MGKRYRSKSRKTGKGNTTMETDVMPKFDESDDAEYDASRVRMELQESSTSTISDEMRKMLEDVFIHEFDDIDLTSDLHELGPEFFIRGYLHGIRSARMLLNITRESLFP